MTVPSRGRALRVRTLSRRAVLRGLGGVVSLPWLEAMAAPARLAAPPPLRLVYVYAPNGVDVAHWRAPKGPFAAALPASLAPLERWRADVRQLRGLTQDKARANGDGPGDHARAAAVWLTGVQPFKSAGELRLGPSADQVAAAAIGGSTRVRSLVLGVDRGRGSGECDSGYACEYSNNVSWADASTPVAKETDPRRAFDRLFRAGGAGADPAAERARRARRGSVLDFLGAQAKDLEARLGAADRRRLDQYASGLRELERRIEAHASAIVEEVPDSARPSASRGEFSTHAKLLCDVVALALESDVTRVATLMLGNEGSGRRFTEVGVTEGHHPLSHHGNDAAKLEQIQRIDRLHATVVEHLVARLAGREEDGARLLDRTMLVFGACIADGNSHAHHDLPTLLIGGRAADLGPGDLCRKWPKDTPLNDLHLALLARLGVGPPALGDARGALDLAGGDALPEDEGSPQHAGPKPPDAKPTDAKPTDAKPTDAKPTDAKPTDAKPTDPKPTGPKPPGPKPPGPKPPGPKPPGPKPPGPKPPGTKPRDPKLPDPQPGPRHPRPRLR